MKRYDITTDLGEYAGSLDIQEDANGQWVRYEEAKITDDAFKTLARAYAQLIGIDAAAVTIERWARVKNDT